MSDDDAADSERAFREWLVTGEIPAWRMQQIEDAAIADALGEAIDAHRRALGDDERPCFVCGWPVLCEPDYPADVRVVCRRCRLIASGESSTPRFPS